MPPSLRFLLTVQVARFLSGDGRQVLLAFDSASQFVDRVMAESFYAHFRHGQQLGAWKRGASIVQGTWMVYPACAVDPSQRTESIHALMAISLLDPRRNVHVPWPPVQQPRRGAYLLVSSPLVMLLDNWAAELGVLRQRIPEADVTTLLASCHDDLSDALQTAAHTDLYITVDDAMRLTNRCRSAITRLCRKKGALIGAHRMGGVWSIDRAKLEAYLAGEIRSRTAFVTQEI